MHELEATWMLNKVAKQSQRETTRDVAALHSNQNKSYLKCFQA